MAGAGSPARNVSIAVISTIAVFAAIVLAVVNSPGWERVKAAFFNSGEGRDVFPLVARAFELNVKMFMIAEVLVLAFALVLAVVRNLPGPVFFPLRLMVIAYTDFFRGVPTILVVYVLGFGMPGLQLTGIPTSPVFWGVVSLVLVYSAYVAEVYRAGIESVHPSQEAAARSLGLSRGQTLRYVIVPQAIRRVIPPLLNDFIGLQKDTALVSFVGVVEVFRQMQQDAGGSFNFTPYVAGAAIFLVLTIPMARFVDWLVARDRKRQLASMAR